jgi:hypothetical protein
VPAIPCGELPSARGTSKLTAMIDVKQLVANYVAMWNEPDPDARRRAIADLWTADGVHRLDPPQAMREQAAAIGFSDPTLEIRGHDALYARVARSYEEFVAPGTYVFRPRDNAARIGDVVKFNWEMVSTDGGEIAGVGLDVLVVDDDGRIRIDYQFVES